MIIVKLYGGLGNQLFQYAAARRLAEKHKTQLLLDIQSFESGALPCYKLDKYCINADIVNRKYIERFYEPNRLKKMIKIALPVFNSIPRFLTINEKHCGFDPRILLLPDNVYLRGYWQSELFFSDIIEIIKKEFCLKENIRSESYEIAEQIRNQQNSVSLHIRRGDYVTNKIINSIYGTCPMSYYEKCISELEKQFTYLHIFVFSNDPEWVKENVKFNHPFFVIEHCGEEYAHEDLYLMSLCKYNIIANSTFSWWGAWLNRYEKKKVFAPMQWFSQKNKQIHKLIPKNWIIMDTGV
jgi:hypothetical protein